MLHILFWGGQLSRFHLLLFHFGGLMNFGGFLTFSGFMSFSGFLKS
jgi:hypothetical protein